jgi:hypothetical protein
MALRGEHMDGKIHFDDFLRVVSHFQNPTVLHQAQHLHVEQLILSDDGSVGSEDGMERRDTEVFGLGTVPEEPLAMMA